MTIEVAHSTAPRVSVIIPATASFELLLATLRSLSAHGPEHIPFETIVVLNESMAHEEAHLNELVVGIRVIRSTVNLGLAGAGNRGRGAATGELLVLLHDDAEIEPGWLEALVDAADSHPEAGAIGGKALFPDGRLQSAGMVLFRDGASSAPWCGEHPPPTAFNHQRAVDYCGTSSLLVRAEVWDAIGGLDERFYPVYYVDVDLAMAIRQLGRIVLYQPESRIRHHSGASGTKRWRSFLYARNRRLFVEKWGNELVRHESHDTDLEAAIERAVARAASVPMVNPSRLPAPKTCAGPVPESAYLEKEREVRDAYIAHLQQLVDDLEHRLADISVASIYLVDTRLAFAADGNAYHYQCSGGYPPEDWGLWLGAGSLTIVLPLATAIDAGSVGGYAVVLETVPFLAEGRPSSAMNVSVNGKLLAHIEETRPGKQCYDLPLSSDGVMPLRHLVVTIAGCDAKSPAAIDVNEDTRELSLGIIALTIASPRARPDADTGRSPGRGSG